MDEHGRPQTRAEEVANALTHGAGLVASIVALPVLTLAASRQGSTAQVVGAAIFGATLVLLYLASTLYHAVPHLRAKNVLRVVDHSAIYLLIAGTYTPFTLGALRGPWGWTLLSVIWTLAVLGILAKLLIGFRFPKLSTFVYLGMGWLVLVAVQPMLTRMSGAGLAWIAAGGLFYTGGVAFYVRDQRLRFGHALWHLCVLGGSICHFVAVFGHSGAPVAAGG